MAVDKLQASRFELKYFVNEDLALRVRDFVRCHLDLDEYGVGKPNFAYPVHSLYLDTDDLRLYWATINGDKNRFKLRVRFYSSHPDAPVFFEIKYRINNCIKKQRAGVRRQAVDAVFAGQVPDQRHLVSREQKHLFALMRFCELLQEIKAGPKAHVAYLREAYVPHDDNSARLTLDRQVRIEPKFDTHLTTEMPHAIPVWEHRGDGANTVVELKFTNRYPDWFGELVRRFGLKQCGAAKYVDGLERLMAMGMPMQGPKTEEDSEIFLPKPEARVLISEESQ